MVKPKKSRGTCCPAGFFFEIASNDFVGEMKGGFYAN
jgi:hypothetical protein